jgi:hypothetical protein
MEHFEERKQITRKMCVAGGKPSLCVMLVHHFGGDLGNGRVWACIGPGSTVEISVLSS